MPTLTPGANGHAPDELTDIAHVARTLNQTVVFTHVSVHRWRGQRSIDEAVVQVEGQKANEALITVPRWKLLDAAWQEKFSKLENKLRAVISNASPSFPIPGVYVIPRLRARELFAQIDRLANEQFNPLADTFVAQWTDYVAGLKAKATTAQWEQIERALPASGSALRRKFAVVKHVIPMTGAGVSAVAIREVFSELEMALADVDGVTALVKTGVHNELQKALEKLLVHTGGELTGSDADDFAGEIEQATRKFVADAASAISDGLQKELSDAVENLRERLDTQGVVREATIEMVERAFSKLKSFSFAATPGVLARMREVETKLSQSDHAALNLDNRHGNRAVAIDLADSLKKLLAEAAKESSGLRAFGRNVRSIDVR